MNIRDVIRENKGKFNKETMLEGHEQRFEQKLRAKTTKHINNKLIALAVAAAITMLAVLIPALVQREQHIHFENDDALTALRKEYDVKINEAIENLETVLYNVDDSTQNEIMRAIDNILEASDIMTEIAPLSEEKQLAITKQIYDNNLKSINSIHHRIVKLNN